MYNPGSHMNTALAFLAHPDDAEILCGGTLIRLAEKGWKVHIATVTAGDCGTMLENRFDISSIRTTEATKAAAMIGGVYHCLDERDGLVCYDKEALRKAIDLFRRVAPSLVFTHALRDYMMDHEMVAMLARAASFVYSAPNISSHPLRPGSGIPHLYYCDPVEGKDPFGNGVEPTVVVDISKQLEKKLEMLACHASQREWLREFHGIDEYIDAVRRMVGERGKLIGSIAAEGFVQHRGHAYPQDDILEEMLGGRE
jgi:LmbE family N-acetylglucosaminyl deacetylase